MMDKREEWIDRKAVILANELDQAARQKGFHAACAYTLKQFARDAMAYADATRGGDGGEGYWMMVQALKSIRDLELDRPMLWEGPTAEWQHQQLSLAQTLAAKALAKAERLATTPAVGQGKEAR